MAGIYIHIPFCKQACTYCDFHFSTSMRNKAEVLKAIEKEAELRKNFFEDQIIETLYFGGGTPSLMTETELQEMLSTLEKLFVLSDTPEFTLEANPDDLNRDKIAALKANGVNRLSIGVQSFIDDYLKWMNRAHRSTEAIACIKESQQVGIDNISIDLIYGLPNLTATAWKEELRKAIELNPTHISAYCLTVEPATALGYRVRTGKEKPIDETAAEAQFQIMIEMLELAGFELYELSNFARDGYYSRHNTSYWQGKPYLGLGPSAHSFKPGKRSWNISNNVRYIKELKENKLPLTTELLTRENQFNEWIMTGLRTKWGINLSEGFEKYGIDLLTTNEKLITKLIGEGKAEIENGRMRLTRKGFFLADGIAASMFAVE